MPTTSYARIHGSGIFSVEQISEGSRYELSDGHPIYCAPAGGDHAIATGSTSLALGTDPIVDEIGTDVGYSSGHKDLRAPDVAVGNVPNRPGWVKGAPRLAVEHVSVGQNERDLMDKVTELLRDGTEQVWVVRLVGPRRVEVWRQDGTTAMYLPGQTIEAPGILSRPVLVESLYDPNIAREAALLNLLARHGYSSLDAIKQEGRQEGQREGIVRTLRATVLSVIEARGLRLSDATRARIAETSDPDRLDRWVREAATASQAHELRLGD